MHVLTNHPDQNIACCVQVKARIAFTGLTAFLASLGGSLGGLSRDFILASMPGSRNASYRIYVNRRSIRRGPIVGLP